MTLAWDSWPVVHQATVYGKPKGQPRARARALPNGRAQVYDPGTAEGWKLAVMGAFRPVGAPELEMVMGACVVDLAFFMPRPKRLCRKKDPAGVVPHTSTPDLDNLAKATLDAMVSVGLLMDDALVVGGRWTKVYHAKDGSPGAAIIVYAEGEE